MDDSLLPDQLRRAIRAPRSSLDRLPLRDVVATLLDVYALHLEPLDTLDGAEVWQHHPRVAATKLRLEARFRGHLDDGVEGRGVEAVPDGRHDAVAGMRRLARRDLVPALYDWLAEAANHHELVAYLAMEGGPDADFDDLVAICQVGLRGRAKLTLAANYWDELGRGSATDVHTELHQQMVAALPVPPVPIDALPLEALERKALNGFLATNRALQPELLGSLGLIECQAGPRCRRVVAGMRRLGVSADASAFYEEHATADPRHGKEWIDDAVAPLVAHRPDWGPRILRGAQWRAAVNRRFFTAMEDRFLSTARRAA